MIQKYSGAGNKFIIINNIQRQITGHADNVIKLCSDDPSMDGVIFVESSATGDFKMNYFNKDGTGDALCGNGLRCTVKYIVDNEISENRFFKIEAVGKIYDCEILESGKISVSFPPPVMIKTNFKLKVNFQEWWEMLNCSYVDCGSPHIVVFIDEIEKPVIKNLEEVNINEWGRNIRMHKDLMPEGANVNFVRVISEDDGELEIRSYERGVEGETLACGTGAISSAIIFYILRKQVMPVNILTRSGEYLTVNLKIENNKIKELNLTGKAERI